MKIYYEADVGGSGGGVTGESLGGSVFTPPAKLGGEKPLPNVEEKVASHDPQKSPGTISAPTPETPAPTPFDPSAFAKEFGASVVDGLKPVLESKTEQQMSPEEARRLLNVWEPDDGWF